MKRLGRRYRSHSTASPSLRLISELDVSNLDDLIPTLIRQIGEIDPRCLEKDDTTLLLCEATGSRTPLKNSLLAPFRFFGPVGDKTQLG